MPEDTQALELRLAEAGIECLVATSSSILAKSPAARERAPIFVHERDFDITSRISDRAAIFKRYEAPIHFTRVYVDASDLTQARKLIQRMPASE